MTIFKLIGQGFVTFLGGLIEWVFSILWFPVHLRTMVQTRALESQARIRQANAQELGANAQVMAVLWNLGSDYKPLARHIAAALHDAYGVRVSAVAPGTVVPIEKRQ